MRDLLNWRRVYLSHFRQVIPLINMSLKMVLTLGYESEFPHLQMNPRLFPGHFSLSSSHRPGAQDKQLQSSSQFMLSTLGNVKLSRRAESKLSRSDLTNCLPAISVIVFELYLFLRQDSLYFEQIPNVQRPVAISSAYRMRNIFWNRIALSMDILTQLTLISHRKIYYSYAQTATATPTKNTATIATKPFICRDCKNECIKHDTQHARPMIWY